MVKKSKPTDKGIESHSLSEKEHLETLIKFSKRAVSSQNSEVDEFFVQQVEKLEKRLGEFKRSK